MVLEPELEELELDDEPELDEPEEPDVLSFEGGSETVMVAVLAPH